MPIDLSVLEAQYAAVSAAITAKLAGGHIDNWQVGHVKFDNSSSLDALIKLQQNLAEQMRSIPSQQIDTHQNAIDSFGNDGTEYLNEVNQ